jgi:hypothetical protein
METQQMNNAATGGTGGHNHPHEHRGGEHLVTVSVNGDSVKLIGRAATGIEIKAAAIEQGVPIHLKFVLEEELSEADRRLVEDGERVELHEGLRFLAHDPERTVTISVNEQTVRLHGRTANGREIKAAAIAQNVLIQPNFVLQEELPNGTSKIIGDDDRVHLREHLRFTAIAPDDNS